MRKQTALAISLGLHVTAFIALMYAPPISVPRLPEKSPSEYQQAFAGKEDKIVWYKFKELPDIRPPESAKARVPLKAEVQAKQSIVSSPKNAPKRQRVVVTPVPAVELPPLDLPNLIAVKLPPKQFTPPPDLVKPDTPKIQVPDAPELRAQPLEAARLAKPYLPPPAAKPAPVAKIEAPSEVPQLETIAMAKTGLPATRLPSRAYVPPAPQPARERRAIGAATEVEPVATSAPAGAALPGAKLPARAYAPPSVSAKAKQSVAVPQIDGPAGDVTIAIAGLNPTTTPVQLPAASSPAQFSAGEKVRPTGATSEGAGTGIVAPDLYAHTTGEKKPDLLALSTPPVGSREFIDAMQRHQSPASPRPAAAPSAAGTAVTNAPDPRFNGRDVHVMAIQAPNLTSYSGSWLMWYAPRTMDETALAGMTAPVPYIKVDPKYTQAAQADHLEGRILLACVIGRQGRVSSIELLKGVNDQLNRSAEEALAKWEFYPATRNGKAVDVDVVVEIPFTLTPPAPSR